MPYTRPDGYYSWLNARTRCNNPKSADYPRYGGRGIKMCERWARLKNFLVDMGPRPSPDHTLERLDTNGDYEPSNCVWATRREQALNRRRTIWVEIDGIRLCVKDWARRIGVSAPLLRQCAERRGWDYVAAIKSYETRPVGFSRKGMPRSLAS